MSKKIGVGIIGVQLERSWAAIAHIPALELLPEYKISALSTTRLESATAAAKALNVPLAFDSHQQLVNCSEVDLVAVTVKVPHHLELVTAAIDAGKNVYCEWPLGNGLAEAEQMAKHAKEKGVHAVVGLQARSAAVVNYVRDLIADGYVGEVLSTTLVGSGLNWGAYIDTANAYTANKENGATMLSIPFGHTVDALCYCLGEFSELTATMANRRKTFTLLPDQTEQPMTAEDQVTISGVLASGAVATVHYRGGSSRATNLLWEINGTEGDLQISSVGGHAQLFDLVLKGANGEQQAVETLTIPEKYYTVPAMPALVHNMAQAYTRLANDLHAGSSTCPTFEDAVVRHKMLGAIETAAKTGQRQYL